MSSVDFAPAPPFTSLREKIAHEKAQRQERYASFAALIETAHAAGIDAYAGSRLD